MVIISGTEFLKRIKENADGNYLFYGEEDYLKAHALKSFKDAMGLDEALEIFNLIKIDVLDYDAEKLIDALSMPPMMAEKKLVVVTGLNIKKMNRGGKSDDGDNSVGELRALIDAINHLEEFDYNNLIIIIPAGNITEDEPKKKLPAALASLSEYLTPVKFEASTPQKLSLWVARHFEHHGIKARAEDCTHLVNFCGRDMFILSGEVEKLSLYAKAQGRDYIVREDIPLICCAEMEYGAFEFSNAILEGRRGDALSILSVMKFKQVEPLMVMGELSGIFSDLLRIKIMSLAGKNASQIAAETGINPHKAGLYLNSARKMELSRLQQAVAMVSETDLAMKFRYDSGYLGLEKLICSL